MLELTRTCRQVIDALLAAPVAWQSPGELARTMGGDESETTDALAILDADGWLAIWEREADIVVTLSVAAASSLGVRLVEVGPEETPRWAKLGEPDPPRPKASKVFRQMLAANLDLVVDPRDSVELVAERADEVRVHRAKDSLLERWGKPTLYLGTGLTPWPGPLEGRGPWCPSCRSIQLIATAYCLVCDRWGLDHMILDDLATALPIVRRDPVIETRRVNLQREARKNKRKARRNAQAKKSPPTGRKQSPRIA